MSSASTQTKLMTADEFYEFVSRPENEGKYFELVRGEVVEMSRPGGLHCLVCGNITFLLAGYVRQRGEGTVMCNDPGILLEQDPDTVRGPDVAYFASSTDYEEVNPKWIEETPTLAVEVLSPNDKPGKVNRKVAEYLASGVLMVSVVDPEERDVTVHRPNATMIRLEKEQEFDGGDVLPNFRCRVADFFFSTGKKRN